MNRCPVIPYVVPAVVIALVCGALLAEAVPVESEVESVTVFRGEALVTRAVRVPGGTGELELLVTDLPPRVLGASLSAGGGDGVVVRLVRYQQRTVGQTPHKELAEIEEQIEQVKRDQLTNDHQREAVRANLNYLNMLGQFITSTERTKGSDVGLDAEGLMQLSASLGGGVREMYTELNDLQLDRQDLDEKLKLLEAKRNELSSRSGRSTHEAILFLTKEAPGPGTVRLHYLVSGAGWTPAYNLRLSENGQAAVIEYLADVHQQSGEDWNGVTLTLSTATPNTSATKPVLAPLWVDLWTAQAAAGAAPARAVAADAFARQVLQARSGKAQAARQQLARGKRPVGQVALDLNRAAAAEQQAELYATPEAVRQTRRRLRTTEEGLAVSYALDGRMSLSSRPDRQLLQIAQLEMPAEAYHQAIPLLTSYVYRVAEITNTSELPLLSGPYSAYVDDEFVGKGRLPLLARGQEAPVGFGVDTQLRCRRELTDKSDTVAWGSRVQQFQYRLQLENFSDRPVALRLYDRMPASKSDQIDIKLEKTSDELSDDPVYQRDRRPQGVLRWDLDLAAGSAGPEARQVAYAFTLKFAKDQALTGAVEVTGQMEEDLQRLLQP